MAIAGHRRNRLDADTCETIVQQLAEIFGQMGGPHHLLSGMADGADICAARACPALWPITAILVRPQPDWIVGLEIAAPPDRTYFIEHIADWTVKILPDHAQPFVQLAQYLAQTCDCLVAVWDGKPGQPGGTGHVVSLTKSFGKPVLHLPVLDATPQ